MKPETNSETKMDENRNPQETCHALHTEEKEHTENRDSQNSCSETGQRRTNCRCRQTPARSSTAETRICKNWNLRQNGSYKITIENSHRGNITKACFRCLNISDTKREFYDFIEGIKPAVIGKSNTPFLDEAYIDGLRTAILAFMRDRE